MSKENQNDTKRKRTLLDDAKKTVKRFLDEKELMIALGWCEKYERNVRFWLMQKKPKIIQKKKSSWMMRRNEWKKIKEQYDRSWMMRKKLWRRDERSRLKKKNKLWRERKKNFFNEKKMNRSWMKRISSLYNDTKNLSDDLVCCVVWSSEIYVYDDDEQ